MQFISWQNNYGLDEDMYCDNATIISVTVSTVLLLIFFFVIKKCNVGLNIQNMYTE